MQFAEGAGEGKRGEPAKEATPVGNDEAAKTAQPKKTTLSDWARELPGQKFGQFQVGTLFAKGKTGCVFHARHIRKNLDVALKVLDPSYGSSDALVKRFNRAMKAVLPLHHPNLVKVHGAGKTGPHCWVAMEFVRAESLAAVIARIETVGMFDWRNVLRHADLPGPGPGLRSRPKAHPPVRHAAKRAGRQEPRQDQAGRSDARQRHRTRPDAADRQRRSHPAICPTCPRSGPTAPASRSTPAPTSTAWGPPFTRLLTGQTAVPGQDAGRAGGQDSPAIAAQHETAAFRSARAVRSSWFSRCSPKGLRIASKQPRNCSWSWGNSDNRTTLCANSGVGVDHCSGRFSVPSVPYWFKKF